MNKTPVILKLLFVYHLIILVQISNQLCLQSCTSCSSNMYCLQCSTSNYIAIASKPNKGCLPCQPGCKTCSSEFSVCSSCAIGYYMNSLTSRCLACQVSNCQTCDPLTPDTCTGCSTGYYLIQSSGTCQTCSLYPNAATCRQNVILTCQPRYYVSGGQKCLLCGDNCLKCTSSTFCTQCIDGYFGSNCAMCHSSCQTCIRSTSCLTCKTGLFFNGSLCSNCNFSTNIGCTTCDTAGKCTRCLSSYYLNSLSICIKISQPITGCTRYQESSTSIGIQCKQCQLGYFLSSTSSLCMQCSILCSNCTGMYSTSGCNLCQSNLAISLSSSVCGFRINSITALNKNVYLSEWSYPTNFSNLGSAFTINNTNCPSWILSTRTRVKVGIINGVKISFRIKLTLSIPNTGNLSSSNYAINFNNITLIQTPPQELSTSISKCSQNSSSLTNQYTQIISLSLPSEYNVSNLAPLNMLLSDGSNYLQISTQSTGFFLAISEIFVSYQMCHYSCALCLNDMSCALCKNTVYKLQEEKCVQECDQFYYLHQKKCLKICPQGTYANQLLSVWSCTLCPSQCTRCQSISVCSSCSPGFFLLETSCIKKCPEQYFSNNISLRCQPCSPPCFTCSSSKNCLSCSYNFFYNGACVSSNDCPIGYYPSLNSMKCQLCIYPCLQCLSQTSCKSCLPSAGYLLKNKCVNACPSGYLLNTISHKCDQCNPQCHSCKNQTNICISCRNGFLLDGNCISSCPNGLYENYTGMVCTLCRTPCLTCRTNYNVCKNCVNGYILHEQLNSCILEAQCLAMVGSFLISRLINITSSQISMNSTSYQKFCTKCPQQCISCKSSNQCMQCQTGYYLLNRSCLMSCPFGYFNNKSTKKCQECSSNCTSCLYQSTFCTVCPVNSRLNLDNICQTGCLNKNQIQPTCQKCISPCYTCINNVTKCLTCISGYFYHNITKQCLQRCYDGYFSQRVSRSCLKCDQGCLTCTNTSSQCTSCPGSTYLLLTDSYYKSGICIKSCPSRFFPKILSIWSQICQACQQPCLQCKQASTNCISCVKGVLNVNQCILQCPSDKYQLISNNSCQPCSSKCISCFGSADNQCYSCKSGYYFYGPEYRCGKTCPLGYIQSDISSKCQHCQFPCLQCINSTTTCTKCWNQFILQNNSSPQQYSFYFYGNQCLRSCPLGTFLVQGSCQLCKSPCLQCLSYDICLRCQHNKYFLLNKCHVQCPSGYFQDNILMRCIKCQYPCKTCISQTQCLSCIDGVRIDYTCSMIDECPSGQYLQYKQTNGYCTQCAQMCSQCIDRSDKCLLCTDKSMILFNYKCILLCPRGYYRVDNVMQNRYVINTCTVCPPQCLQCINDIKCTQCMIGYYYLNYKCISICPPTYYNQQINDTKQCIGCSKQCKSCVNSESNCLSCNKGLYWYQFQCIQSCPNGTYIDLYQSNSNSTNGICRQCIFPCKQCRNSRQCVHCLSGFYQYQGLCIQRCRKPLVIVDDGQDIYCVQSCPIDRYYMLDYGNYTKCSNTCNFPYMLSQNRLQCMQSCPQDHYISQTLECRALTTMRNSQNKNQLTNANISLYVDKEYKLKLIITFSTPMKYGQFLQYQAQTQQSLFDVFIHTNLLYPNDTDMGVWAPRLLYNDGYSNTYSYMLPSMHPLQYNIITSASKYMLIDINPMSFDFTSLRNIIPHIRVQFNKNANLLLRSSINSIPLQQSLFKCLMPAYEPYPSTFNISPQFSVFGQVLIIFILIICFVLMVFNWYAKVYEVMHYCQMVFLLAMLQLQYPPNLWLFLQGFANMHWYFIGNWFITKDNLTKYTHAPDKIASIFVDANFIRICGHILCVIILFMCISFILFISKFLTTNRYQQIQKVSKIMYNKFKLIKWSHIHDLVMTIAMIIVFGFFAQMNDYSSNQVIQILGILISYILIALLTVYYVFMGYKLHGIVKMSQQDPNRFCDKKYLFRDNMLSITQSAVHPKQLYLNYLRAMRIVIFGGLIGGFSRSPMLCLGAIITILVVSTLIYLVCKPYPDHLQNLLLGLADLFTTFALFFICLIYFMTFDYDGQTQYQDYLVVKWRLGWVSIILFIITAFLLLAQLLVSIVKGNSSPLKLSAEDPKNLHNIIIGAPKIIEVRPKNEFQGWQAHEKANTGVFGFKYQVKQV